MENMTKTKNSTQIISTIENISSEMNNCPNINSHNNYKLCKRCIEYVQNATYKLDYTPKESNKNKRKYHDIF